MYMQYRIISFFSLTACVHSCPAEQSDRLCVLTSTLHHWHQPVAHQGARLHGDGGGPCHRPREEKVCLEGEVYNVSQTVLVMTVAVKYLTGLIGIVCA